MRLMVTADLHLGSGSKFSDTRLAQQEHVWQEILTLAVEHEVDAVIVAGDVWHRPRPTPAEYLAFLRPMQRRIGARVIVIPGNHDYLAANQPTGLHVMEDASELQLVAHPRALPVGDGTVGFLPWTPPHRMVAELGGSVPRDDINVILSEILHDAARRLMEDWQPDVLIGHWAVGAATLSSGELARSFLREPMLDPERLAAMGYRHTFLGHIHVPQIFGSTGVRYVGSPMPLDFSEGHYEHGVVLFADDAAVVLPIKSTPFLTLDYRDNEAAPDAIAFMSHGSVAVDPVPDAAIVRIRYRATAEQQVAIDTEQLIRKLLSAGASRVFVLPEIVRATRARVEVEDGMSAPRALYEWLRATDQLEYAEALADLTDELLEAVR